MLEMNAEEALIATGLGLRLCGTLCGTLGRCPVQVPGVGE
jgi:hypothetical protein